VTVVVLGQVGRDIVLRVDDVADGGEIATVHERQELLGGKGANQAVGLCQLGVPVALVGVVGDDHAGRDVRRQAAGEGIDVGHVVVRPGATTALFVDITDGRGARRVLEHVTREVLLSETDVAAAADLLGAAATVVLQLQQPAAALLLAVGLAPSAQVVLDGAPGERVDELLRVADVLRADATEAELLVGRSLDGPEATVAAARDLLDRGPKLVVLGVAAYGDVLVWPDGQALLPHHDVRVVDPTGGGDSFVAGLVAALRAGATPAEAGAAASRAAARTVAKLGGRPALELVVPLPGAGAAGGR
jgi:ribokinase